MRRTRPSPSPWRSCCSRWCAALGEYPRPRSRASCCSASDLASSIGSRTLGGFAGVAMPAALRPAVRGRSKRRDGLRGRLPSALRRFILSSAARPVCWLMRSWRWSGPGRCMTPLNPCRALTYFSHFFEEPWRELFGGELILVPDMPRSYVPTLFALQAAGTVPGARSRRRARCSCQLPARRDVAADAGARFCSACALAAVFPACGHHRDPAGDV